MTNNNINDYICPLCQQPNQCKSKDKSNNCWCDNKKIPEALLAKVPESLKNKTCICESCINSYNKAKYQQKCQTKKEIIDDAVSKATIERGQVVLITGNGKGKSTAGFGTVVRSLGHGYKAAVAQFIKGSWECGERNLLVQHGVPFSVMKTGFTWDTQDKASDMQAAMATWQYAKALLKNQH